MIKIIP